MISSGLAWRSSSTSLLLISPGTLCDERLAALYVLNVAALYVLNVAALYVLKLAALYVLYVAALYVLNVAALYVLNVAALYILEGHVLSVQPHHHQCLDTAGCLADRFLEDGSQWFVVILDMHLPPACILVETLKPKHQ